MMSIVFLIVHLAFDFNGQNRKLISTDLRFKIGMVTPHHVVCSIVIGVLL